MPYKKDRYVYITDQRWFIRSLEIFPGALTWTILAAPVLLSIWQPILVAIFIIAFDLFWLVKSFRLSTALIRGYRRLHKSERVDWSIRLDWIRKPDEYLESAENKMKDLLKKNPKAKRGLWQPNQKAWKQHSKYVELSHEIDTLRDIKNRESAILHPDSLFNLVIMAVYNETQDIIEPSIKSLLEVDYPAKQLMLVVAYEERGPESTKQIARDMVEKYGPKFAYAAAIEHPDGIEGEVIGKGGNITFAGRKVTEDLLEQGVDPEHVIVTTFDSDHRAGRQYFTVLSYIYAMDPNRNRKSYQPVPMFYNNIWDVPAPMRIIATNNSFWLLMETMRPHRLRNFAAHAQSLRALLDTDFWSVSTPVEDGHQYWRSYFAFNGDHHVVPMYVPVYQDAVLAETYPKTFIAQYKQLRRWAYGISDFPYVVRNNIRNSNIPLHSKIAQTWRQIEGHISWSTTALIVTFVAWLPLFLNEEFRMRSELAHQLPILASYMMNIALVALIIMIAISMISLPPRPARYGHRRNIGMLLQWILLPVVSIAFSAMAAIDAQTRLMLGKYLAFQVTPKSRKK